MLSVSGASKNLRGALTGAGELLLSGGVTTLGTGVTATVAKLYVAGAGTSVKLQTNLGYGGQFNLGAGTSLSIATGTALTLLQASTTLAGTASGASLVVTGGAATLATQGAVTTANWTNSQTSLTISGPHAYAGAFSASAATITLNGALQLSGASSFTGDTLTGVGQLQLSGAATVAGGLTLGGSTIVTTSAAVTQQGGNVKLGDTAGLATKIFLSGAGASWSFADNSSLVLNNAAASTIVNAGLIAKTGGTGTSVVGAALANSGKIQVASACSTCTAPSPGPDRRQSPAPRRSPSTPL